MKPFVDIKIRSLFRVVIIVFAQASALGCTVLDCMALDKSGYIDHTGELVVKPDYNGGGEFQGKYAAVEEFAKGNPFSSKESRQWSIIDHQGQKLKSLSGRWLFGAGAPGVFRMAGAGFYDAQEGKSFGDSLKIATKFGEDGFAVVKSSGISRL